MLTYKNMGFFNKISTLRLMFFVFFINENFLHIRKNFKKLYSIIYIMFIFKIKSELI